MEKLVVCMYWEKERAIAAFEQESKDHMKWPGLHFNWSTLTITGQGITKKFMSGGGDQLRGMDIDKFFYEDIGPFWGNTHFQKLFKASQAGEI